MSRRMRGAKTFELLVVMAIVAVLIVLLWISTESGRKSARVVRCASNLKQLFMATSVYFSQNDNWMLPALFNSGDSPDDRWYGSTALGPAFAVYGPTSGDASLEAKIKKMLDCPAINHPAGWGPAAEGGNGKWGFDYTYNQTLGSNSAPPGAPYDPLYPFVKRTQVRPEVLIATEVRDVTNIHDYVFNSVTPSLVPTSATNTADYQAIAGMPHGQGNSGNMLFSDGAIVTDDINKLLGPPARVWTVLWDVPKTEDFPFN